MHQPGQWFRLEADYEYDSGRSDGTGRYKVKRGALGQFLRFSGTSAELRFPLEEGTNSVVLTVPFSYLVKEED